MSDPDPPEDIIGGGKDSEPNPPGNSIGGGNGNADIGSIIKEADSNLLTQITDYLTNPGEYETNPGADPVFFNSKRNKEDYVYIPKKGIGIQKEGDKLHGFTYTCETKAYSQSRFGEAIEDAKQKFDIYALQTTLLSAYKDLIFSRENSSDMKSYSYLCAQSLHALSDTMRDILHPKNMDRDGGIALALVSERLATVNDTDIFNKRAVLTRTPVRRASAVELTNEEHLQDLFAAFTPSVQTEAILKNNGIQKESSSWVSQVLQQAPSVDELIQIDFKDLDKLISGATEREQEVIHRMYAGMLGQTRNVVAPPIRRNMLENGLDLYIATALEKSGTKDLTKIDDRTAYRFYDEVKAYANNLDASDFKEKLQKWYVADDPKKQQELQQAFNNRLQGGRQDALLELSYEDKKTENYIKNNSLISSENAAKRSGEISDLESTEKSKRIRLSLGTNYTKPKIPSILSGLVGSGMKGILGALGGVAGGLLGAVPMILQSLPMIMELSQLNAKEVSNLISERNEERQALADELQSLVSLMTISTENSAEDAQAKVQTLIEKVKKPSDFGLSTLQGLGLSQELEQLASSINPNGVPLTSLKPYETDVDLVAGIAGGTALCSVRIYLTKENIVTRAPKKLLNKPKIARVNGSSHPFRTEVRKCTSEKEAKDFEHSVINSSYSFAEKTRNSSSSSTKVKASTFGLGFEHGTDMANESNSANDESYSDDVQFQTDDRIKTKYAIVCEYAYMPMGNFSLVIAGLVFSDYAFFRLQQVDSFAKAIEWMNEFGSHVPLGDQTIGGIFLRKMTMISKEAIKLTTLYSAGMSKLTDTSTDASTRKTDSGASVGFFSKASVSNSNKNQNATVSGETAINTEATGVANSDSQINASFQCTVTSYGPNATTMSSFYEQLSTNNATWTIIDRGEPEAYISVWELLDYIGQGVTLQKEKEFLKSAWEYLAIQNTDSNGLDDELLSLLMNNIEGKKNVYKLVNRMVDCLVSLKGIIDQDVCDQFVEVLKKAVESQRSSFASSPRNFILNGFDLLKDEGKYKVLLFDLNEDCISYIEANDLLARFSTKDMDDFTYNYDEAKEKIAEKDTARHLLQMCQFYRTDRSLFEYIKKFVVYEDKAHPELKAKFENRLRGKLLYVENEKCCLHHAIYSQNLEFIKMIYYACPEAYSKVNEELKTLIGEEFDEIRIFFNDMENRQEKVSNFVQLLATCAISNNNIPHDYEVVDQFNKVVVNGLKKRVMGTARSLVQFLFDGFGSDGRLFEIYNDSSDAVSSTYETAKSIYVEAELRLQEMESWENDVSKTKINFAQTGAMIREKDSVYHLVDLCRKCTNEYKNWGLFKQFLRLEGRLAIGVMGTDLSKFVQRQLKQKDVDNKLCLHYLVTSKDFELIRIVYEAYPGAKAVFGGESKLTPLQFAEKSNEYTNEELNKLRKIIPDPEEPGAADFEVDFSKSLTLPPDHILHNGASIQEHAPDGLGQALLLKNYVKGSTFERAQIIQSNPHQYVELKLPKALSALDQCMIVFEIYFISQPAFFVDDQLMSKSYVFSEGGSDTDRSRALYIDNKGTLTLKNPEVDSFSPGRLDDMKQWLHMSVIFEEGTSTLIVDGTERPDSSGTFQFQALNGKLFVGGHPDADKYGCDCWIKSIKIYEKKLSLENITSLANAFYSEITSCLENMKKDPNLLSLQTNLRDKETKLRAAYRAIQEAVVDYPNTIEVETKKLQEVLDGARKLAQQQKEQSIDEARIICDQKITASAKECSDNKRRLQTERETEKKRLNDLKSSLERKRGEISALKKEANFPPGVTNTPSPIRRGQLNRERANHSIKIFGLESWNATSSKTTSGWKTIPRDGNKHYYRVQRESNNCFQRRNAETGGDLEYYGPYGRDNGGDKGAEWINAIEIKHMKTSSDWEYTCYYVYPAYLPPNYFSDKYKISIDMFNIVNATKEGYRVQNRYYCTQSERARLLQKYNDEIYRLSSQIHILETGNGYQFLSKTKELDDKHVYEKKNFEAEYKNKEDEAENTYSDAVKRAQTAFESDVGEVVASAYQVIKNAEDDALALTEDDA